MTSTQTEATPAASASTETQATPASDTQPSSGDVSGQPGEQTATGKEPTTTANKVESKETGKSEVDGGKPAGDKPQSAPEPFQYKPSPEGFEIGEGTANALTDVARELNLTNEAAQKIVDKMAPALTSQAQKNLASMIEGWKAESKQAFGDKLSETDTLVQKALDMAQPELRKLLGPHSEGGTELIEHKVIKAWLAEIGRKIGPDTKVVKGSEAAPPRKTPEERLADTYRK